MLKLFSFEFDL